MCGNLMKYVCVEISSENYGVFCSADSLYDFLYLLISYLYTEAQMNHKKVNSSPFNIYDTLSENPFDFRTFQWMRYIFDDGKLT